MKNPIRYANRREVVPKGATLFHGSAEKFSGSLRPGVDGVIWFADQPSIAQLYIPNAGITMISDAREFRKPSKDDLVQLVQKAIGIEYDLSKVEFEFGEPRSWPSPKGWDDMPRVAEIEKRLEALGYEKNRYDSYELKFHDGKFLAGNESAMGRLFIAKVKEDLRIWNRARGESDLMDLQYNDIKSFRDAEKAGYDGVIIDDFAQSKEWGNLGHQSLGLFRHAIRKLQVNSVPAQYREWSRDGKTPEYPKGATPWLHRLAVQRVARRWTQKNLS